MTIHVIWATDGSPGAMEAVPILRGPLNRPDVRVSVVAVTPGHDIDAAGAFREPVWGAADDVLAEAQGLLDGLVSTSETVLLTGNPSSSLIEFAERQRADLVVIGSRGFGPIRRLFVGSVSEAVAYRATCSVLVVREQPSVWQRVLVGFDESEDIDAGIDILCRCHPPSDGRVTLAHVILERAAFPRSMQTRDRRPDVQIARRALHGLTRQAELRLAVAKRELLAAGWAHVDSVIEVARPAAQLKMRLRRDSPDLLVLGAVGRGIRMHPGNVSSDLLHAASCSVLIGRAPRPARPAESMFMLPG